MTRPNGSAGRWPDYRSAAATFCSPFFYDPTAPSYADIAGRLGVSPDTLGPLRGRCLKQLRLILEQDSTR